MKKARRLISFFILLAFFFNTITPAGAQLLPPPGTPVGLTPGFQPPVLVGLKVHPENPLLFDFIVDQGETRLSRDELKTETEKLIKYFLAALTIPDKEIWVNLSPNEKDRIIPDVLGQTVMGKTMLEQDYLLKQIASSLTNPDEKLGQEFWSKVKGHVQIQMGTADVPMNTFNKVWIVPAQAEVLESEGIVVVKDKKLKVMMADDYEAFAKNLPADNGHAKDVNAISSAVFKQTILPNIEKEINEGKNFADVRQIYNSAILAAWYKQALKESLLGKVYADKGKVVGVETDDKKMKQRIYEQYISAFKKGVYNLIKEEVDSETGDAIPRKYFSGGLQVMPGSASASSSLSGESSSAALAITIVPLTNLSRFLALVGPSGDDRLVVVKTYTGEAPTPGAKSETAIVGNIVKANEDSGSSASSALLLQSPPPTFDLTPQVERKLTELKYLTEFAGKKIPPKVREFLTPKTLREMLVDIALQYKARSILPGEDKFVVFDAASAKTSDEETAQRIIAQEMLGLESQGISTYFFAIQDEGKDKEYPSLADFYKKIQKDGYVLKSLGGLQEAWAEVYSVAVGENISMGAALALIRQGKMRKTLLKLGEKKDSNAGHIPLSALFTFASTISAEPTAGVPDFSLDTYRIVEYKINDALSSYLRVERNAEGYVIPSRNRNRAIAAKKKLTSAVNYRINERDAHERILTEEQEAAVAQEWGEAAMKSGEFMSPEAAETLLLFTMKFPQDPLVRFSVLAITTILEAERRDPGRYTDPARYEGKSYRYILDEAQKRYDEIGADKIQAELDNVRKQGQDEAQAALKVKRESREEAKRKVEEREQKAASNAARLERDRAEVRRLRAEDMLYQAATAAAVDVLDTNGTKKLEAIRSRLQKANPHDPVLKHLTGAEAVVFLAYLKAKGENNPISYNPALDIPTYDPDYDAKVAARRIIAAAYFMNVQNDEITVAIPQEGRRKPIANGTFAQFFESSQSNPYNYFKPGSSGKIPTPPSASSAILASLDNVSVLDPKGVHLRPSAALAKIATRNPEFTIVFTFSDGSSFSLDNIFSIITPRIISGTVFKIEVILKEGISENPELKKRAASVVNNVKDVLEMDFTAEGGSSQVPFAPPNLSLGENSAAASSGVFLGEIIETQNPLALAGASAYEPGTFVFGDNRMANFPGNIFGHTVFLNVEGASFNEQSIKAQLHNKNYVRSNSMSPHAVAVADFSDTMAKMPDGSAIPSFELALAEVIGEEKGEDFKRILMTRMNEALAKTKEKDLNEKTRIWAAPLKGLLTPQHFKKVVERLGLQLNPNFSKTAVVMREELGVAAKDPLVIDIATGINAEIIEAFLELPSVKQGMQEANFEIGAIHAVRLFNNSAAASSALDSVKLVFLSVAAALSFNAGAVSPEFAQAYKSQQAWYKRAIDINQSKNELNVNLNEMIKTYAAKNGNQIVPSRLGLTNLQGILNGATIATFDDLRALTAKALREAKDPAKKAVLETELADWLYDVLSQSAVYDTAGAAADVGITKIKGESDLGSWKNLIVKSKDGRKYICQNVSEVFVMMMLDLRGVDDGAYSVVEVTVNFKGTSMKTVGGHSAVLYNPPSGNGKRRFIDLAQRSTRTLKDGATGNILSKENLPIVHHQIVAHDQNGLFFTVGVASDLSNLAGLRGFTATDLLIIMSIRDPIGKMLDMQNSLPRKVDNGNLVMVRNTFLNMIRISVKIQATLSAHPVAAQDENIKLNLTQFLSGLRNNFQNLEDAIATTASPQSSPEKSKLLAQAWENRTAVSKINAQAHEAFKQGNFAEAEKLFRQVVAETQKQLEQILNSSVADIKPGDTTAVTQGQDKKEKLLGSGDILIDLLFNLNIPAVNNVLVAQSKMLKPPSAQKKVSAADAPAVRVTQNTQRQYGGIDFDPSKMNLQIKRNGRGVPLPLPQQNIEQINIQGLVPIIINIVPVNAQTLPIFLGQAPQEPADEPKLAATTSS